MAADAPAPITMSALSTTISGIALDSPWKAKLYVFARAHFYNPAWGWSIANVTIASRKASRTMTV